MTNFLDETKEFLSEHGKSLDNILFIQDDKFSVKDKELFFYFMNFEYDDGFGSQEIPGSLIMVGKDFWIERHEYDGSEWWEFKQMPIKKRECDVSLKKNEYGDYELTED